LTSSFVWAENTSENIAEPSSLWKHKFGGEERLRHEYKQDFDFNEDRKDNGSLFFHRLRLNGRAVLSDENLKEVVEIFAEGLDAQIGGYRIKAAANQKDDFDFHQGYIHINEILGSDFDFKIGRQELKYGKGRLIAAPTWANRIRSFDATVLHYDHEGWYGDVLYGQDVKYDDNNFNKSLDEEFLSGIYGGGQKSKGAPLIEGYFLTQIDSAGAETAKRYTAGFRLQGIFGRFNYDMEVPFQFGETQGKDIQAYAVHAEVSRGFDQMALKPKLTLEYNQATGDQDFFRWQNMREAAFSVHLSTGEKLTLVPQMNFFWLESKFDSWYNSSGTALRSQTVGERGYYVGHEISLRVYYDVSKNIKWESGGVHFFTGGYVQDSGANDDADWFYSQVSLKY
jgi:hypothetical protein